MTIAFSTHIDNKPTHFVEKIWAGIISEYKNITLSDYEDYTIHHKERFNAPLSEYDQMMIDAKIHTIREDSKDRWKVGMKIHPVIHNRTKNRFQFAPVLEVKGIQEVEISYHKIKDWDGSIISDNAPMIRIDGRVLTGTEAEVLATNDGFDSLDQFFAWFNKDFTGKIIHWTNFNY